MAYNDVISRTGAAGVIKTETATEIFKEVSENSSLLPLMRRTRDMPTKTMTLPVSSLLPSAYFVNSEAGDSLGEGEATYQKGTKQTSKQNWGSATITAEEIAVIVPVSKAVVEDAANSGYDLFGEIKPELVAAFGVAVDAALLHGTSAPTSWPTNIVAAATAKSQVIDKSNSVGSGLTYKDMYDAILGEGGLYSMVEADGYDVNGVIAATSMKASLRGLRSSDGVPIFSANMQQPNAYLLNGNPINFPKNGALDASAALMIVGDFSKLVYSWRKDITYEFSDQAVIIDPATGAITHNLWQQNMVGIKLTARIGVQIVNPENRIQPTDASRYPFALLKP